MGIAPLKEPPVLPSCFWAWFSPGQEQVGNKCESPPQEEMGREVSRLHLFCHTPQESREIFEAMSFFIKVEEENLIPLSFACHCLLLLFLINSNLYPTAAHTHVCVSYFSLTNPSWRLKSFYFGFLFFYGTSEWEPKVLENPNSKRSLTGMVWLITLPFSP